MLLAIAYAGDCGIFYDPTGRGLAIVPYYIYAEL